MSEPSHASPTSRIRGALPLGVGLPAVALCGLVAAALGVPGSTALAAPALPKPCHDDASQDVRGVCQALGHYLQAHATGQGAHAQAAFYPDARMVWVADGEIRERPIGDYIAGFRGEPEADEARRERWVESVDVTGDAAVAKIVLDYPGARIVDYMTLLRTDGEWRIIHKSFHAERKTGT